MKRRNDEQHFNKGTALTLKASNYRHLLLNILTTQAEKQQQQIWEKSLFAPKDLVWTVLLRDVRWEVGGPHNHHCSAAQTSQELRATNSHLYFPAYKQAPPRLPLTDFCLTFIIYLFIYCVKGWLNHVTAHTWRSEDTLQIDSLLLPHGFWGLNSDHVAYHN